jgi:hypothetical protein
LIVTGAVRSMLASDSSSTAGGGLPASQPRAVDAGEEGVEEEGGEDAPSACPQEPSARLWLSNEALEQLRRGMWWRGAGTANPTDRDAGGCCIARGGERAGANG